MTHRNIDKTMKVYGTFPSVRMRRMRRDDFSRRLMREHVLTTNDLICPVFVLDGKNAHRSPCLRCPASSATPSIACCRVAEQALEAAHSRDRAVPGRSSRALKTPDGARGVQPEGPGAARVRELKKRFPELGVITDVALDPYTTHGQDGVIDETGYILNDETVAILEQQALTQAEAGVDIVAPSDMMDGRIGAIRAALDARGATSTPGSWPIRPSTPRPSTARSATPSARPEPREERQDDLPDGPGELRRGAARGRARSPGRRRHGDGEARHALSRHRAAREGRVQGADLRLPGERRVRDAQGRVRRTAGWTSEAACWKRCSAFKRAGADGILTYFARDAARLLRAP